jgi:hypothetical protein
LPRKIRGVVPEVESVSSSASFIAVDAVADDGTGRSDRICWNPDYRTLGKATTYTDVPSSRAVRTAWI